MQNMSSSSSISRYSHKHRSDFHAAFMRYLCVSIPLVIKVSVVKGGHALINVANNLCMLARIDKVGTH